MNVSAWRQCPVLTSSSSSAPRGLLPHKAVMHPRRVALRAKAAGSNGDHAPTSSTHIAFEPSVSVQDRGTQPGQLLQEQELLHSQQGPKDALLPSAGSSVLSVKPDADKRSSSDSSSTNKERPTTLERLSQIAAPIMFQNVVGFANCMISMAYVGGIGAVELSAYVLACSVYNVSGLSVALGLSTGMDTLAGSAYGAKEYHKLGSILQRAVVVCWAACVPLAAAWLNSEPLLLMLGQKPEIAKLGARFLIVWTPCLFLNVVTECFRRFLQAQSVVKPLAVTGAISVALAPSWYYLFMTVWGLGLDGSAFAFIASQVTTLIMLFGYVAWRTKKLEGKPEQAWVGFDLKAAFTGWGEYLQYGVPAAVMICLEWWVFEAVVIMSGWMPDAGTCLACMGILVNINAWCYMLPLGLAAGVNTLVANALGAGSAVNASRVFNTGVRAGAGLQFLIAATAIIAGPALIRLLCQDPAVRAMASAALPVLACVMVLDGMNAVVAGVLRGAGRQRLGAIVNGAACALAIPAAWMLAFKFKLGVPGAWMGVGAGAAMQLGVLLTILLKAKGGKSKPSSEGLSDADLGNSSSDGSDEKPGALPPREPKRAAWDWDWDAEAARVRKNLAAC
mmetsp:Transcript_27021/g.73044  ORF Transcript_27021/g.73044 Transcript_27021/m.73044 type:complete len:618 (-) Transcript_27021:837-2690(-)